MYYDLHIHSALSPCGDDDMTVNNIVNMSLIKGLECIAITDHNSMKQLRILDHVIQNRIKYFYGVEIQTREEVHLLAYFKKNCEIDNIQEFLNKHLILEPNDPDYFGHQYILDEYDQVIDEEGMLLIKSLNLNVKETIDAIHELEGIVFLAHIYNDRFSYLSLYMDLDFGLDFDGIEVKSRDEKKRLLTEYPQSQKRFILMNSDAHQLIDIQEAINEIDYNDFLDLWRKRYG